MRAARRWQQIAVATSINCDTKTLFRRAKIVSCVAIRCLSCSMCHVIRITFDEVRLAYLIKRISDLALRKISCRCIWTLFKIQNIPKKLRRTFTQRVFRFSSCSPELKEEEDRRKEGQTFRRRTTKSPKKKRWHLAEGEARITALVANLPGSCVIFFISSFFIYSFLTPKERRYRKEVRRHRRQFCFYAWQQSGGDTERQNDTFGRTVICKWNGGSAAQKIYRRKKRGTCTRQRRKRKSVLVADRRESRCEANEPRALVNTVYSRNTVIIPKRAKKRKKEDAGRRESTAFLSAPRAGAWDFSGTHQSLRTVNMGTLHTMHILGSFYVAGGPFSIARANRTVATTTIIYKGPVTRAHGLHLPPIPVSLPCPLYFILLRLPSFPSSFSSPATSPLHSHLIKIQQVSAARARRDRARREIARS